jgi:hypothetical protein
MTAPRVAPRQLYHEWVEEQIEEYKAALTRDELLEVADQAVDRLFGDPDGQYPLTEILLSDAVDRLLFERLNLPAYRDWERSCRIDTDHRSREGTPSSAHVRR